jgi:Holliday junction resolvase
VLLPGVLFEPAEGSDRRAIEVDLLAVKGGRVIIGECKAQGRTLDESGTEVQRLAELAALLDCTRVVYATPTNFDGAETAIARA